MSLKIYRCPHCGNIITHLKESGVNVYCCGAKMELLVPNTSDAAGEKHVPVILKEGNKVLVKVGEVPHPMLKEHHIEWIILQTSKKYQVAHLKAGEAPEATFVIDYVEEIIEALVYCNLHGLWVK